MLILVDSWNNKRQVNVWNRKPLDTAALYSYMRGRLGHSYSHTSANSTSSTVIRLNILSSHYSEDIVVEHLSKIPSRPIMMQMRSRNKDY